MEVYLDNAASTKPDPKVIKRMGHTMEAYFGNPSSLHRLGLQGEGLLSDARKTLAQSLGVDPRRMVFTSGGTESDNLALLGAARWKKGRGRKIITSAIEHDAVLKSAKALEAEGFSVIYIGVDDRGHLDWEQLKSSIDEETVLISLMHVNNQLGTVFPIKEVSKIKGDALFHVDAVQSFGKIPIPVEGVDLISLSAHKIHGPKGVGALYVAKGAEHLKPLLVGGGQEKNLRSGTENVSGIDGFALASSLMVQGLKERQTKMKELKNRLIQGLQEQLQDLRINSPDDGIGDIVNISFPGARGEVLLHGLEQRGVYVSTGSACGSHRQGDNYVLKALGLSRELSQGTLRFSFSQETTDQAIDYTVNQVVEVVQIYGNIHQRSRKKR